MVYAACEPVLWRPAIEKGSAGSRVATIASQLYPTPATKCLLSTEYFKRSVSEASHSLLEDIHHVYFAMSKQHKISGLRFDSRQGTRCYLSIDSAGMLTDIAAQKAYPLCTGYIGLLDMALAHSGEEHLPHDQDRAFFKEYMDQFTHYSSRVKSYLSRLNHSSNVTMNSVLSLQSAVFPWERLLLRLAGWQRGVPILKNVYSISHIYNLLYADMTRGFAGVISSTKHGVSPRRVANRGPGTGRWTLSPARSTSD